MLASTQDTISKQSLMHLHKLDSFLRESQRLHPNHVLVMSRYVGVDTTLSDGTVLPKGISVAMPVYAINRDPTIFEDPDRFDPERFERLRKQEDAEGSGAGWDSGSGTRWSLTHTDPVENVNFGYGKHVCPGRFLAASEVGVTFFIPLQPLFMTACF